MSSIGNGKTTPYPAGWEFIALPGPTNIPNAVMNAMHRPALDFMTDEFRALQTSCHRDLMGVLKTEKAQLTAYASTGHGSWEAAMTNTCSPGDLVLIPETGNFSEGWNRLCHSFGLRTRRLPADWDTAIDPTRIEQALRDDREHEIKAVCVVHNETSTGIAHDVAAVRRAIDDAGHPALLMVDTISSLGSFDFRFDEWGVDVAVIGSQKGLMLPVGLGFSAASAKALRASETATLPRRFFDWRELSPVDGRFRFAGTAPMHMFFAMRAGLDRLLGEGLEAIFARHHRLAEATRRCVEAWSRGNGPSLFARYRATCSDSVTCVRMPDGMDANVFRAQVHRESRVALGGGLGKLDGQVFRIGHLGDLNEPMLLGTLATLEMQLRRQGIPHGAGGVDAAMAYLAES
jgi:alanine-glyoxylate transaminase/serine-glyoxylate transaminase/serine-pyruvate transaminase